MTDFLKWTLETIRADSSRMSWMEEKRFDWVPLTSSAISSLLEGTTFIITTDKEREWFGKYLVESFNRPNKNRPLLPFFSFKSIFSSGMERMNKENIATIDDLLSISFANGYRYFYIGSSNDPKASLAKSRDDSLIWIMDEQLQNAFYMNSKDEYLDEKLIQLARLFDKSMDVALFGEVEL